MTEQENLSPTPTPSAISWGSSHPTDAQLLEHIVDRMTPSQVEEHDRAIDRVRRDVYEGRPEPPARRIIDPYDVAQHEAERFGRLQLSRDPSLWRQVMEYHGFTWY